mmetsp:Transcript_30100/g.84981  ORF Transcript_30100/g.84981 Transcript_30100/m.84981 type:complete len:212 (+) Transcript_30100:779-1414(+)
MRWRFWQPGHLTSTTPFSYECLDMLFTARVSQTLQVNTIMRSRPSPGLRPAHTRHSAAIGHMPHKAGPIATRRPMVPSTQIPPPPRAPIKDAQARSLQQTKEGGKAAFLHVSLRRGGGGEGILIRTASHDTTHTHTHRRVDATPSEPLDGKDAGGADEAPLPPAALSLLNRDEAGTAFASWASPCTLASVVCPGPFQFQWCWQHLSSKLVR